MKRPSSHVLGVPFILKAVEACDVQLIELLLHHGASLDTRFCTMEDAEAFLSRPDIASLHLRTPPPAFDPDSAQSYWDFSGTAWHALCRSMTSKFESVMEMAAYLHERIPLTRDLVDCDGATALYTQFGNYRKQIGKASGFIRW